MDVKLVFGTLAAVLTVCAASFVPLNKDYPHDSGSLNHAYQRRHSYQPYRSKYQYEQRGYGTYGHDAAYKAPVYGYEQPKYGYGYQEPKPVYGYEQPTYGYEQPAYGYDQPAYAYEAPKYEYEAPKYGYAAPSYGYEAPKYGYAYEVPAYTAPKYGYEAPSYGYEVVAYEPAPYKH